MRAFVILILLGCFTPSPAQHSLADTSPAPVQADTSYLKFRKYFFNMEVRLGAFASVNDQRTSLFLKPYGGLGMGIGLCFGKTWLFYSFNPTSLRGLNKDIVLRNGNTIGRYSGGRGKKGSDTYWLNIIRHSLELGYEMPLSEKMTQGPMVTVSLTGFHYVDSLRHNPSYDVPYIFGYSAGWQVTRYFKPAGPKSNFYLSLSGSYGGSALSQRIPGFGSQSCFFSLSLGLKGHPGKDMANLADGAIRGLTH